MKKYILAGLFLFALLLMQGCTGAKAQAAEIEYIRLEQGDSFLVRPQLKGMTDLEVQESINLAIFEEGGYPLYISFLNSLTDPDAAGIQVKAQAKLLEGEAGPVIVTILIQASGRIGPGRPGYRKTALMYELGNGERVLAEDIFKNEEAAITGLNEAVASLIEPGMSDYLAPEELYPVPLDSLLLDEAGVTFYYDQSRFTTLSGQSGAVNLHFDEIKELLNVLEGSVLYNIGIGKEAAEVRLSVELLVGQGRLPGLPSVIGEKTYDVLSDYPPLFDSESFPTGEKYQPEDARFRGNWLVSDGEEITGLISARMNFFGLLVGQSSQADLVRLLGDPQATVTLDEDAAISYGFSSGLLQSYVFGDYTLYFNFDDQNILHAIWLSQSKS